MWDNYTNTYLYVSDVGFKDIILIVIRIINQIKLALDIINISKK